MGKKYVIELEDKPLCVYDKDTCTYFPRVHRVKGFNTLVFDEVGLSKLTPIEDAENMAYTRGYTAGAEDKKIKVKEAYKRGYEEGLASGRDEAWEAARKICTNWTVSDQALAEIFGYGKDIDTIMHENTASEAIAKLKAYEEKEKADEEKKIKVGDEIASEMTKIVGVVTAIDAWNTWHCVSENGRNMDITADEHKYWKKTGRYFPQVKELLEEMKGGEE